MDELTQRLRHAMRKEGRNPISELTQFDIETLESLTDFINNKRRHYEIDINNNANFCCLFCYADVRAYPNGQIIHRTDCTSNKFLEIISKLINQEANAS